MPANPDGMTEQPSAMTAALPTAVLSVPHALRVVLATSTLLTLTLAPCSGQGRVASAPARPLPTPAQPPAPSPEDDIGFEVRRVEGVHAQIVKVNLRSSRVDVRPMVAGHAPLFARHRVRTFASMIAASRCEAAINGTFFDLRTAHTLGTCVYQGRVIWQGYVGNALAVDRDGNAHFVKLRHVNNRRIDWSPYRFAIGAGPSLIEKGRISVHPRDEGFRDRHLCGAARRSALGFTQGGKMLMVTVPQVITLSHLARVMRALDAHYALNLDGGTSSALYYQGRYITRPGRTLTNILGVQLRPAQTTGQAPPGPPWVAAPSLTSTSTQRRAGTAEAGTSPPRPAVISELLSPLAPQGVPPLTPASPPAPQGVPPATPAPRPAPQGGPAPRPAATSASGAQPAAPQAPPAAPVAAPPPGAASGPTVPAAKEERATQEPAETVTLPTATPEGNAEPPSVSPGAPPDSPSSFPQLPLDVPTEGGASQGVTDREEGNGFAF